VAHFALISWKYLVAPESHKVTDVTWQSIDRLTKLAFDHKDITNYAVQRLQAKVGYSNVVYGLLPE
jgi:8-oxo-dGTP diphosphatase